MRAVSWDKDAASLMGINVDTTISVTFAIGSAFAAVAGVLLGLYYNTLYPMMGFMPGLKAFVAAVLGWNWSYSRCFCRRFFVGYCRGISERLLEQCVA
jgi:branched-subunit amino acid ABC-type transport system permease component